MEIYLQKREALDIEKQGKKRTRERKKVKEKRTENKNRFADDGALL